MRIVHSLWSKPHEREGGPGRVRRGFPTTLHYWASWAYSALTARANYGNVHLVTDSPGASALVDGLGLPYDSVRLDLDAAAKDANPGVWAFGKLVAYAIQEEPFYHIDNDAFLLRRLPQEYEAAPVVVQCAEGADRGYVFNRFVDELPWRIDGWDQRRGDGLAWCTGILGGRNVEAITGYARGAMRMVTDPANADKWNALNPLGDRGLWPSNIVVEQQAAYCYFAHKGIDVATLARPGVDSVTRGHEVGFTHLMGRRYNTDQPEKMLARFAAEFPAEHERVVAWTTKQTGTAPKATGRRKQKGSARSTVAEQWAKELAETSRFEGPKLWAAFEDWARNSRPDDDGGWTERRRQFNRLVGSVPCGACRADFIAMIERTPPPFSHPDNGRRLAWVYARHDEVNFKLGRPAFWAIVKQRKAEPVPTQTNPPRPLGPGSFEAAAMAV